MRNIIIVCVLLFIVAPVLAQDATLAPEVTAEPSGGIIDSIPPEVVTAIVDNAVAARDVLIFVLILALVAVVFVAMPLLYRSASPFVQQVLGGLVEFGMVELVRLAENKRDEAAENEIDWDDPIWTAILAEFKRRQASIGDTLNPPQEPPQVLG
jgi:hypothetical protein